VLKCGAAWLPLDPGYPVMRLEQMVADAAPKLVLADSVHDFAAADVLVRGQLHALAAGTAASAAPQVPRAAAADAYVLFTSGSTGRPKGSVSAHAGAVSRCRWMWAAYEFGVDDVFAQRTSLNFVDSVWEIFGPLLHGGRLAVLPARIEFDAAAIKDWLAEQAVAHLVTVPSLLGALLDAGMDAGSCPVLHSVICSGEALRAQLAGRFCTQFPVGQLLNTYGTSETWDVCCYEVCRDDINAGNLPVGKPVANARAYILDSNRQLLPPGAVGELYVGGLALAREYLGDPELTRERFFPDPWCVGGRIYRTGDLARFGADGTVELLGRRDRQIKLRGLRIEAADVEEIALTWPGVSSCALVLQQPTDAEPWLALHVAGEPEAAIDSSELRVHLATKLPRSMVPADIFFADSLPLTPSGKIDVLSLQQHHVGNVAASCDTPYAAPRDETEIRLERIWAEALGLDRVSVHDDFFALRGHSLLATRVIARVGDAFGVEVPLQSIFEAPTIAGLARNIEALLWTRERGAQNDGGEREVMRL
jgi:iturin family lipopeptide synthetase A